MFQCSLTVFFNLHFVSYTQEVVDSREKLMPGYIETLYLKNSFNGQQNAKE